MHRQRQKLTGALCVLILLAGVGCAASKANNPQLDNETIWILNTGENLTQIQTEREQFFLDVGKAQAGGILNDKQVAGLVAGGDKLKLVLDEANTSYKTYTQNPSADLRSKIIALMGQASMQLTELAAQKAAASLPKTQ